MLLTELDQKFSVAFPLMRRKRQNAGQVVAILGAFLLREVANYMAPNRVDLAHDVKQEWVDIVVQCLTERRYEAKSGGKSVGRRTEC